MSGASNGNRPRIIDWRPHEKGNKLGAAAVLFPSGLTLHEVSIHRSGDRCWAAPPARAKLMEGTNEPIRDRDGRLVWEQVVSFPDVEVRRRWSDQVIAAMRADRPEVLGTLDEAEQLL